MKITFPIIHLKNTDKAAATIKERGAKGVFVAITFRTSDKSHSIATLTMAAAQAWNEAVPRPISMMFSEMVVSSEETVTFETLAQHDID